MSRMTAQETADLLNSLIIKSKDLLEAHPYNKAKKENGERMANLIWPWGGGYRPSMKTLMEKYPQVKSGSCISAVDLIKGIGKYAGLTENGSVCSAALPIRWIFCPLTAPATAVLCQSWYIQSWQKSTFWT